MEDVDVLDEGSHASKVGGGLRCFSYQQIPCLKSNRSFSLCTVLPHSKKVMGLAPSCNRLVCFESVCSHHARVGKIFINYIIIIIIYLKYLFTLISCSSIWQNYPEVMSTPAATVASRPWSKTVSRWQLPGTLWAWPATGCLWLDYPDTLPYYRANEYCQG